MSCPEFNVEARHAHTNSVLEDNGYIYKVTNSTDAHGSDTFVILH